MHPINAPPSLPAYDRAQLLRQFGPDAIASAQRCVSGVSNLAWSGRRLHGSVRGPEGRSYDASVYFDGARRRAAIDGACSCSIGYACKHILALLLAALEVGSPDAPQVRAELVGWLEGFRQRLGERADRKPAVARATHALVYIVVWSAFARRHEVRFAKASLDRTGAIRSIGDDWDNVEHALLRPPKFVSDDDLAILRLLRAGRTVDAYGGFALSGARGAAALERMVASGRLFAQDANGQAGSTALRRGAERPGHLLWQTQVGDRLSPVLQTHPPSTMVILTDPVWYVDQAGGEAGVTGLPWETTRITDYLSIPPISDLEAPFVAAVLQEIAPELPAPPTRAAATMRVLDVEPVPVLQLDTGTLRPGQFRSYGVPSVQSDHATVRFDYEGLMFDVGSTTTLVKSSQGEWVHVKRRMDTESRWLAQLHLAGLEPFRAGQGYGTRAEPILMLGLPDPEGWAGFVRQKVPELRQAGWRVEMADGFRHNVVEVDFIGGHVHEAADGWFDVEMGIVVGDRTVRLEPLLAELFRRDRRWLTGALDLIPDTEAIDLPTDRGERLRIGAVRLKPVVQVLIDLFDGMSGGGLRVSRLDAGRLEALGDTGRWQFHGEDSVRHLAQRLRSSAAMSTVRIPVGLRAELRSYQHQGLNWMQFLREHGLSGVLADDMGLGKTVQTLAHILLEKEAGRLDRPALIVVPTSLVHNWREEARRFAPGLRVLSLHGPGRRAGFDRIAGHDVVLTTYALLWRDHDVLSQHRYHLLILDEAQFVKNASTRSATLIRGLAARHRLCLTGTPLENHLGELWSLFDFLLPGFLGSQKEFTRRWRTPIEKGGDTVRRDLLARRIRPFMLRRRKDDVARELPSKTTIIRSVELDGAQRDLYETVRAAMQEKVRAAIAEQGRNRSHIIVLDALLKLRQVCCDPRLVKLAAAARVKESAKLELLISIVPDMIEEGRRILVFSQFTGMLELIAAAMTQVGIAYVTLTGDTTDRATPVRRFQQGEVPLFLISLKAGGVGLNLTAADTVIHYDPWWNPATENQASDRAHRLGQDKPVFIYKLIVAGSIEDKILLLQEKKAALADGILSNDGTVAAKFSADDLDALFAPIPPSGAASAAH